MTVKAGRALAAILLLGVILGVGLVIWAGGHKTRIIGPTALAEDSRGRVWMVADAQLFLMQADGRLIRSWPGEQFGASGPMMALSAFDDGRVLLGDHRSGRILVVDDQGDSQLFVDPASTASGAFFDVFSLAYDPKSQTVFASDTSGHRLLSFDHQGALLGTAGGGTDRTLKFPNALGVDRSGQLYVANTNLHRVDFIHPDLTIGTVLATHDRDRMHCCPWPVAAGVAPGGQRYASWLTDSMNRGAVYKFDDAGQVLFEVKLPNPGAWVVALLARDTDVLAADSAVDGFTVHRFGHDGRYLGAFGDAGLQQALAASRGALQRYTLLRGLGILLALASCVGLLLVARRLQAAEADQAAARNPLPARQHLQTFDPRLPLKAFSPLIALIIAIPLLLLIGHAMIAQLQAVPPPLTAILNIGLIVVMLVMVLGVVRSMRRTSSFQQYIRVRAERLLHGWGPALGAQLEAGEPVIGAALVSTLQRDARQPRFVPGLLVWTPRQLMILPPMPGLQREPIWRLPLADLSHAESAQLSGGWLYWLLGRTEQLVFSRHDARRVTVSLGNPGDSAAVLADILGTIAKHAQSAATEPVGAPSRPAIDPAARRRTRQLSLLLPGLGQFHQRRIVQGSLFLVISLYALTNAFFAFHAYGFQTAEVSPRSLLLAAGLVVVCWLAAYLDVWRYDRPADAAD